MRILFVIRAVEHYYYFKSIVDALFERNHHIRVLFDKNFSQKVLEEIKEVRRAQCEYSWGVWDQSRWRRIFYIAGDILSWKRYFNIKEQSDFYRDRWQKFIPFGFLINLPFLRILLINDFVIFFLKLLVKLTPADREIVKDVQKFAPHVVVASPANMPYSSCDIEYLRAAKKLRIPTILPVFSWDNLTTKGQIHVRPDLLLVWNKTQEKEAYDYHGIRKRNTRLVGSPMFDFWFEKRVAVSRRDYCARLGLDPQLPMLLYLESSNSLTQDERWLVKKLHKILSEAGKPLNSIQIIVRPHPFLSAFRDFNFANVVVVPRKGEWLNSEKAIKLYYDSLCHADLVFGINTSGLIDATIADKSAVSMIVDRYSKIQLETQHFRQLVENDVLKVAGDFDKLISVIGDVLKGKDEHKKQRANFVRRFIRPRGLDMSAGEAAAAEIEKWPHNFE